jgi:hypothetical protein
LVVVTAGCPVGRGAAPEAEIAPPVVVDGERIAGACLQPSITFAAVVLYARAAVGVVRINEVAVLIAGQVIGAMRAILLVVVGQTGLSSIGVREPSEEVVKMSGSPS